MILHELLRRNVERDEVVCDHILSFLLEDEARNEL